MILAFSCTSLEVNSRVSLSNFEIYSRATGPSVCYPAEYLQIYISDEVYELEEKYTPEIFNHFAMFYLI